LSKRNERKKPRPRSIPVQLTTGSSQNTLTYWTENDAESSSKRTPPEPSLKLKNQDQGLTKRGSNIQKEARSFQTKKGKEWPQMERGNIRRDEENSRREILSNDGNLETMNHAPHAEKDD